MFLPIICFNLIKAEISMMSVLNWTVKSVLFVGVVIYLLRHLVMQLQPIVEKKTMIYILVNNDNIFFRKKREGVNSIEMVFSTIESLLPLHTSIQLPCEGASPKVLFKNILFAYRNKAKINHITGDAHYIALGLGRNTVLTIHDVQSAMQINNPLKRLYVKLFWFWLPALMVGRITVISEFTKNELSKIIPFAKNKILVIHNAFNPTIGYVKK